MTARPATAFGEQLRSYRERVGLSQDALADRAGLAVAAISAWERGDRRRPAPRTVRLLADAIGLSAEDRAAFGRAAPATPAAAQDSRSNPLSKLPSPRTMLIGRERERSVLPDLVRGHAGRLVTLTGVGGAGKTRLAMQVAADLAGAFPGGVHLVELAPVAEPALVGQAVAAALGVGESPERSLEEALAAALRPRAALLVLDNCEHLIDACAQFAERLLVACPDLRLLATSREPLGLPGERQWRVQPLDTPDADGPFALDTLAACASVRLFVERAQAVRPDFALTAANAGNVARICGRLDGIPLALELAAAWVRVLAVEQILARLDDTLRLLTGGGRAAPTRQQTLQATLDWSYSLLTQPERAVFRRLAAFSGGFYLEAAEAVCAAMGSRQSAMGSDGSRSTIADCPLPIAVEDVLDILSRLVDKSLVQVEAGEPAGRFRLLEPVRQYAAHHLAACGEREEVVQRHAGWYLTLAERAATELRGPAQVAWLGQLDRDYGNLRAALSQAEQCGDLETLARLAVALTPYWEVHGTMSEGRRWLEPVLASDHPHPIAAALRRRALFAAGRLAFFQTELARATELFAACMSLGGSAADEQVVASALTWLGFIANRQGDFARAEQRLEESLESHLALGNGHDAAWAIHGLGAVASNQGDATRASAFFAESLRRFQSLCDLRFIAIASLECGYAELVVAGGDLERAGQLLRDGLRGLLAAGDRTFMIGGLLTLAVAESQLGRQSRAARLLGALRTLRAAHGVHTSPIQRDAEARLVGVLRPRMGETAFAAALTEGRRLTVEQAIAETLSDDQGERSSSTASLPTGSVETLTAREQEVARLLARGYSDRQIAEALTIALSTVGSHVHHLLAKLGVRSRWQVAEWALAHGLTTADPD